MDAISKDFKIEVPDDAILHCCLQIAQKTNQVVRIIEINRIVISSTFKCHNECNLCAILYRKVIVACFSILSQICLDALRKSEEKRSFRRHRPRQKVNIKMDV